MLDVDGNVISSSELVARIEDLLKSVSTTEKLFDDASVGQIPHTDAAAGHAHALHVLRGQLVVPDLSSTPGPTAPARRFIKRIIRKLTWWYVEPRWGVQYEIDGHTAHFASSVVNDLGRLAAEVDQLRRQQTRLLLQSAQSIERFGGLRDDLRETNIKQDELQGQLHDLFGQLRDRLDGAFESIDALGQSTATVGQFDSLRSETEKLMARLGVASASGADIDYVAFEEQFRGSSDELRQTQAEYIRYFPPAEHPAPILDIGCGRGEMLEALVSAGHVARGVDRDSGMVKVCLSKGLDVIQDDAINYLDKLETASLKGIFCAQVVEHLLTSELERLVQLSADKLIVGGVLVVETINPRSLHAFANHFLADTSHVRPVHPETLRFICEQGGFSNVALVECGQHPYAEVPDDVPEGSVRDSLAHLLRSVYGFQDYVVVATK